MSRLLPAATSVALLVAVLGLVGLLSQSALAATLAGGDARPSALLVEVEVPELWPGHVTTMAVRVTSTTDSGPLKITALRALVGDAGPGCLAGNIEVVDHLLGTDGPVYVVEAGGSVTVPLAITMLDTDTDQDACKGVSFPIEVTADAVPA